VNRVLITGSFGYLGGRIAHDLAASTDLAILLGTRNGNRPTPEWLHRGEIVSLDLLEQASVDAACRDVDAVIHLAAMNEIDAFHEPLLALDVNGGGALRLLRAAEKAGVQRFINFSTAHIYASPLVGRYDECTPVSPVHPYAISHRIAEEGVLTAQAMSDLTGIVLRLSNGFGAPLSMDIDRWKLLVNDLCRQAVETGKIQLHTSGLQMRNFIAMADICAAVRHFLYLPEDLCADGLFNLGGEHALRVIEMAEMIARRYEHLFNLRPSIHRPEPEAAEEPAELEYSIDKLKKTGFKIKGSFESEIDDTLRLCQQATAEPHAT